MGDERAVIKISVRELVEFLLREGDIDNRHGRAASPDAMFAGSRMHRKIQKGMGPGYHAEVPLKAAFDWGEYDFAVEGRADGIIIESPSGRDVPTLGEIDLSGGADFEIAIDEIKGVYRKLERIERPMAVHRAQAMCYAYMFAAGCRAGGGFSIAIQLTYCNLDTEEVRRFREDIAFSELEAWFFDLIGHYRRWADFQFEWQKKMRSSIRGLTFPYPYRKGQRELTRGVYRTIARGKILFLQAPTGVGKTISAVFPAVMAVGEGIADRIFYLTAKTVTGTVAREAFELLRGEGYRAKILTMTAKEKICCCGEMDCNPEGCERARGHYDRVNDAVFDLVSREDALTREAILEAAERHMVCPFEFSLDVASWSDVVICDYNYLFDPDVCLKRFFAEGARGPYVFLVDEAHNLVDRGREIFSAELCREDFLSLKKKIAPALPAKSAKSSKSLKTSKSEKSAQPEQAELFARTERSVQPAQLALLEQPVQSESLGQSSQFAQLSRQEQSALGGAPPRGGYAAPVKSLCAALSRKIEQCARVLLSYKKGCDGHMVLDGIGDLRLSLTNVASLVDELLQREEEIPARRDVTEFYFALRKFLNAADASDERYVTYAENMPDGRFKVRIFCVDPSLRIQERLDKGVSAILFSATFLPIKYYMSLLSTREDNYAVYAETAFSESQRLLLIGRDASSRYSMRNAAQFSKIAEYIAITARAKEGNYIAYFPSYQMMRDVYEAFLEIPGVCGAGESAAEEAGGAAIVEECAREESSAREAAPAAIVEECAREVSAVGKAAVESLPIAAMIQRPGMPEDEREAFLAAFSREETEKRRGSLAAFCVLGGIFGEGIDLKNEQLIGAVIVGTGLPQVSSEGEILRDYFDGRMGRGEGFAYAYRYPGMNKVLQAAGRVIRTASDVGVILLLDDRFLREEYEGLFPREWQKRATCTIDTAGSLLREFWDGAPSGH